ncbi:protein argonaute 7-like [Dorcoceras hygrometricum]|uniref:Protein argonaute 7-like n=1 Tax=Dorcoceras hygrometricum TaxID=472368 RepID=A0A2Z7AMW8_9LAMI|nr:protein argonaute 7-like [Dorcoceras hygrometricum]
MSSLDTSVVRRVAESSDSPSSSGSRHEGGDIPTALNAYKARLVRIAREKAELASSGCTWYNVKASIMRESDIPLYKDNSRMNNRYEIIIPDIGDRAHCPPPDFHTFYMNQIDMDLRFPIPRFIVELCRTVKSLGIPGTKISEQTTYSPLRGGVLILNPPTLEQLKLKMNAIMSVCIHTINNKSHTDHRIASQEITESSLAHKTNKTSTYVISRKLENLISLEYSFPSEMISDYNFKLNSYGATDVD